MEAAPPGYEVEVHSAKLPVEAQRDAADADFSDPVRLAWTTPCWPGRWLKPIQLVSAGFDQIDIDLCRRMGIPVANNAGQRWMWRNTSRSCCSPSTALREMDANAPRPLAAIDSGDYVYDPRARWLRLPARATSSAGGLLGLRRHALLYADAEPALLGVSRTGIVRA